MAADAGGPAVPTAAWLDTGLDADAVEFCPQSGHTRWAVAGTYKLRESAAGGMAHQQTRDGELIIVDVNVDGAEGDGAAAVTAREASRIAVPGVFDIKWSGAVGSHSPSLLGHAAADGTLRVYSLSCNGAPAEAPHEDLDEHRAGRAAGGAQKQPAAQLTEVAQINCASEGDDACQDGVSGIDGASGGVSGEGTMSRTSSALSLALAWDDTRVHAASPTAAVSMSDGTVSRHLHCMFGSTALAKCCTLAASRAGRPSFTQCWLS